MKVCSKVMDTVKKYLIGSDIEILVRELAPIHKANIHVCIQESNIKEQKKFSIQQEE